MSDSCSCAYSILSSFFKYTILLSLSFFLPSESFFRCLIQLHACLIRTWFRSSRVSRKVRFPRQNTPKKQKTLTHETHLCSFVHALHPHHPYSHALTLIFLLSVSCVFISCVCCCHTDTRISICSFRKILSAFAPTYLSYLTLCFLPSLYFFMPLYMHFTKVNIVLFPTQLVNVSYSKNENRVHNLTPRNTLFTLCKNQ